MATKCEVCGKGTTFGRNIRHQHSGRWQRKAPKTNRTFSANVHVKSMTLNGVTKRYHVCTRCIRTAVKTRSLPATPVPATIPSQAIVSRGSLRFCARPLF
jgi:large subunit ribosomal protein L28